MPYRGRSRGDLVAVIDVGSNSGRVVVFERDTAGHLRTRAGSRASLRLVHDVDARGELTDATMARTMEALRDFKALATGAGARRIVAVATAAMRDAGNGALFAERLRRELGIRIEIISGISEARYGFTGCAPRTVGVQRAAVRSGRRQHGADQIRSPAAAWMTSVFRSARFV
jgi:exopolyphosphatase/guanosine-5'-triphosphate,3'-diphosphate pyrophosphatase